MCDLASAKGKQAASRDPEDKTLLDGPLLFSSIPNFSFLHSFPLLSNYILSCWNSLILRLIALFRIDRLLLALIALVLVSLAL